MGGRIKGDGKKRGAKLLDQQRLILTLLLTMFKKAQHHISQQPEGGAVQIRALREPLSDSGQRSRIQLQKHHRKCPSDLGRQDPRDLCHSCGHRPRNGGSFLPSQQRALKTENDLRTVMMKTLIICYQYSDTLTVQSRTLKIISVQGEFRAPRSYSLLIFSLCLVLFGLLYILYFIFIHSFLPPSNQKVSGTVIISILQLRKPRSRKVLIIRLN